MQIIKSILWCTAAIMFLIGCQQSDKETPDTSIAAAELIDGVEIQKISTPKHDVLYVEGEDDAWAVMRLAKPDAGGTDTGPSSACLACKINKLTECAKEKCNVGDAKHDCTEKINSCVAEKCATKCAAASSDFTFSTGTFAQ